MEQLLEYYEKEKAELKKLKQEFDSLCFKILRRGFTLAKRRESVYASVSINVLDSLSYLTISIRDKTNLIKLKPYSWANNNGDKFFFYKDEINKAKICLELLSNKNLK